jgi:hypothetical protein
LEPIRKEALVKKIPKILEPEIVRSHFEPVIVEGETSEHVNKERVVEMVNDSVDGIVFHDTRSPYLRSESDSSLSTTPAKPRPDNYDECDNLGYPQAAVLAAKLTMEYIEKKIEAGDKPMRSDFRFTPTEHALTPLAAMNKCHVEMGNQLAKIENPEGYLTKDTIKKKLKGVIHFGLVSMLPNLPARLIRSITSNIVTLLTQGMQSAAGKFLIYEGNSMLTGTGLWEPRLTCTRSLNNVQFTTSRKVNAKNGISGKVKIGDQEYSLKKDFKKVEDLLKRAIYNSQSHRLKDFSTRIFVYREISTGDDIYAKLRGGRIAVTFVNSTTMLFHNLYVTNINMDIRSFAKLFAKAYGFDIVNISLNEAVVAQPYLRTIGKTFYINKGTHFGIIAEPTPLLQVLSQKARSSNKSRQTIGATFDRPIKACKICNKKSDKHYIIQLGRGNYCTECFIDMEKMHEVTRNRLMRETRPEIAILDLKKKDVLDWTVLKEFKKQYRFLIREIASHIKEHPLANSSSEGKTLNLRIDMSGDDCRFTLPNGNRITLYMSGGRMMLTLSLAITFQKYYFKELEIILEENSMMNIRLIYDWKFLDNVEDLTEKAKEAAKYMKVPIGILPPKNKDESNIDMMQKRLWRGPLCAFSGSKIDNEPICTDGTCIALDAAKKDPELVHLANQLHLTGTGTGLRMMLQSKLCPHLGKSTNNGPIRFRSFGCNNCGHVVYNDNIKFLVKETQASAEGREKILYFDISCVNCTIMAEDGRSYVELDILNKMSGKLSFTACPNCDETHATPGECELHTPTINIAEEEEYKHEEVI